LLFFRWKITFLFPIRPRNPFGLLKNFGSLYWLYNLKFFHEFLRMNANHPNLHLKSFFALNVENFQLKSRTKYTTCILKHSYYRAYHFSNFYWTSPSPFGRARKNYILKFRHIKLVFGENIHSKNLGWCTWIC